MKVRVLGAHQSESSETGFTSMLVDDVLAIDAGSLASRLSIEEQFQVRHLLLTHRHWDHIKDVPAFGFNLFSRTSAGLEPLTVDVHGLADVREILDRHLMTSEYWLDFFETTDGAARPFRYHLVDESSQFEAGGYRILAIPSNHGVPTIGFQIESSARRRLYYTSDNGPGSGENWKLADPDLLITECTYSNAMRDVDGGRMHGHLCPNQLSIELESFGKARGYLPRVVVLHLNPFFEVEIRRELASVARDLQATIEVAAEGSTFTV